MAGKLLQGREGLNLGNNVWSESFFALLKREVIHGANFRTREEARVKVFSGFMIFIIRSKNSNNLAISVFMNSSKAWGQRL